MQNLDTIKFPVVDSFSDNRPPGKVIGMPGPDGFVRKGADAEKVIAIDHGALRIGYPSKPGWKRHGIAYGPFKRENGLAFSVFLVNGHNNSQTDFSESLMRRLSRFVIRKFLGWIPPDKIHPKIRPKIHFPWPHYYNWPHLRQNLAVGWFPSEAPSNPRKQGNAFLVHSLGEENAELWAHVDTRALPAVRGMQNLQMYYVVMLREQGAAYYVSSMPDVPGIAAYPNMRPVAIDPFVHDKIVYAAVYQSILGEIGFRVDTRIYGAKVMRVPEYATWYGTACAADTLEGSGALENAAAEIGGVWMAANGKFERTSSGTRPQAKDSLALLDSGIPSGLIHSIITTSSAAKPAGIVWRAQNKDNFWSFLAGSDRCQLYLVEEGRWRMIAESKRWSRKTKALNSLQILNEGWTFSLFLNGSMVFNKRFHDRRLSQFTGVGIFAPEANGDLYFRHFEAHPYQVLIPAALDLGAPVIPNGALPRVADNFGGPAGELTGRTTTTGNKIWKKQLGAGIFRLTGSGAVKVQADVRNPNPGRTAYTIAWDDERFAELEVEILPPGTGKGQGEKGRGGVIFWQDEDNYIIMSTFLDDWVVGKAVASFFYINGVDDLYRAVWTNVGNRVHWGIPYTLRVLFDGVNYIIYLNDEPVLYRAITDVYPDIQPFVIRRVGIVANWEFGDDTGSEFRKFVARAEVKYT